MRHKELITTKLERLNDELSGLLSLLSYSKSIMEVKNRIFEIKEVDRLGAFKSDDEIGFFFNTVKTIQETLNNFAVRR